MLFNSIEFLMFFLIVYGLYLRLGHRGQNRLLLAASYIFYGSWDWRFLSLILFSTYVNYLCALKIAESPKRRTKDTILVLSVIINLGILAVFKYLNFFITNMESILGFAGIQAPHIYLHIILPMGISFYTFQTMSYTIDVHRGSMKPTRHFADFALYVAFFPQLVAGPIERASHLLPQVLKPRSISREGFYEGCFLIFWGIFQKVFIADNLAGVVDPVFDSPGPHNGMLVLLAAYAFTYQIYCDFAGYSNVARGLGKIMGFDIMVNFNLPYFVTNIQDFWNRWHISLSTWLRDYLYLPLLRWMRGVKGNMRMYVALMITMTLIGLWHGAAWNFVVFGVYYGVLLVAYTIIRMKCQRWIQPKSAGGKQVWLIARMVMMYHIITVGMLIFRAPSIGSIFQMLWAVLTNFRYDPAVVGMLGKTLFFSGILLVVQVMQYRSKDLLVIFNINPVLRTAFYFGCLLLMTFFGDVYGKEFIYFQF